MVSEHWDNKCDDYYKHFFDTIKEESYRILRFGGRFLSFGSNDTLAHLYGGKLKHRELLIVDKGVKIVASGRNTSQYRQHINHTEYIIVATKYAREYCKKLLLDANYDTQYSSNYINQKLDCATNGGGMWSIYTGNNKCNQVPTNDQWKKFGSIFELPNYSTFEEVYVNGLEKGNILFNYNFKIKNREHPTQKPVALMEYLIETYSVPGCVVLDFTMGSGSTGVAALKTKRRFIGIEKEQEYYDIACRRIKEATRTLF